VLQAAVAGRRRRPQRGEHADHQDGGETFDEALSALVGQARMTR